MGKRKPVVTLSSSEEDECRGNLAGEGRGSSRPRPRAASAGRKRTRGGSSRKGCVANASPQDLQLAKFDTLSEDFCECLHEFSITPGSTCTDQKELWVDKHKPRTLAELAVHKKKVEEVKKWLEERVKTSKDEFSNCVLLIIGQAGVGKSATIRVIASQLGAELCEWTTPTPTLWQEHLHNTNSGIRYMSKLDEFENFVEKIRKYPLLHQAYIGGSRKPVILLIDDIPVTNGRIALARLSKCLTMLTQSTQVPTVILITEYHKPESCDSSTYYWEELVSSLERAGAFKVAFNPITVNSIKRTLTRICQEEKFDVTAEWIDQIAKSSGGDIRHAITSLQYCCLKPDKIFCILSSARSSSHSAIISDKPISISNLQDGNTSRQTSLPCEKDEKLTLFHALGKFLHNKREMLDSSAQAFGPGSFALQERYTRPPLKMDAPEKVLSQAHGQPRSISDFLHENVLDFISNEAIDDAWSVTSYLSDADYLLASSLSSTWRRLTETYEVESLAQSVAVSVAVRGVLFGNSQPSTSRWHTIRSPRIWQIEQSSRYNKSQMLIERFKAYNMCTVSCIATEYRPTIKWLSPRASLDARACEYSLPFSDREDDESDCMGINMPKGISDASEDSIEEW